MKMTFLKRLTTKNMYLSITLLVETNLFHMIILVINKHINADIQHRNTLQLTAEP